MTKSTSVFTLRDIAAITMNRITDANMMNGVADTTTETDIEIEREIEIETETEIEVETETEIGIEIGTKIEIAIEIKMMGDDVNGGMSKEMIRLRPLQQVLCCELVNTYH